MGMEVSENQCKPVSLRSDFSGVTDSSINVVLTQCVRASILYIYIHIDNARLVFHEISIYTCKNCSSVKILQQFFKKYSPICFRKFEIVSSLSVPLAESKNRNTYYTYTTTERVI